MSENGSDPKHRVPSSETGRAFVAGMDELLHSQLCSVYGGGGCDCFKADIADWTIAIEDDVAAAWRAAVIEARVSRAEYEDDPSPAARARAEAAEAALKARLASPAAKTARSHGQKDREGDYSPCD